MTSYDSTIEGYAALREQGGSPWAAISPESAARMKLQNRFLTGLDIARSVSYTHLTLPTILLV